MHHRLLLSCIPGGTQHSDGLQDGTVCLSELVYDFLQDNQTEGRSLENDSDLERVDSASACPDLKESKLSLRRVGNNNMDTYGKQRRVGNNNMDTYGKQLLCHVSEAVEILSLLSPNVSIFRRNVVEFLRKKGYNAAICETKWAGGGGGVIPGCHEFIDVARGGSPTWQNRYLEEVDFRSQFEIARPTKKYEEILSSLPRIFVGRREELKRSVRVVCDVAEQCFEGTGRSVSPWRTIRFMKNKWLAPYRRLTDPVQGVTDPAVGDAVRGGHCRSVGFYDIVSSEARPIGVSVCTR